MHGLVNRGLQSFVQKIFGEHRWQEVRGLAGLSFQSFETMLSYDDIITEKILNAVEQITNRAREDLLEDFGTFIVSQHSSPRVLHLLRLGGETFAEFLFSLEEVHDRLQLILPDLEMPYLDVVDRGDGKFSVFYESDKSGYSYVFLGLLRAMADKYGAMVVVENNPGMEGDVSKDCFDIQIFKDAKPKPEFRLVGGTSATIPAADPSVALSARGLDRLMPMHMRVDAQAAITHVGPSLAKLTAPTKLVGQNFFDAVLLRRPDRVTDMEGLWEAQDKKILLNLIDARFYAMHGLVERLEGGEEYLINLSLGSRMVKALQNDMLTVRDFAVTESAMDMIYMLELQSVALDASRGLNNRLHGAKTLAEEKAYTDSLTGLNNRRALRRHIRMLTEAEPPKGFALVMIDLDHFKSVNDTLGHAAGDHVLKDVADALLRHTRSTDMVARVGGDEFVIVLANVKSDETLRSFAERLVEALRAPIPFGQEVCRIGASIGATIVKDGIATDVDSILSVTDKALYNSKETGRGRVTLNQPKLIASG